MNTHLAKVKESIVAAGSALLDKGLVSGTWGNVSARIAETDYVAVTPSGRNYRSLIPDDIVIVDLTGTVVDGSLIPSSELPLHLAIYRARPDIGAIVHTHSVYASSCAVARKPIPPVIEDLVQLSGGAINVADYALPGTADLANNAVAALGDKFAVLLANHGVVGCGRSLPEAMTACELVEKAAQILIFSAVLGGPNILNDTDVTAMHRFYTEHYRTRQS